MSLSNTQSLYRNQFTVGVLVVCASAWHIDTHFAFRTGAKTPSSNQSLESATNLSPMSRPGDRNKNHVTSYTRWPGISVWSEGCVPTVWFNCSFKADFYGVLWVSLPNWRSHRISSHSCLSFKRADSFSVMAIKNSTCVSSDHFLCEVEKGRQPSRLGNITLIKLTVLFP